MFFSISDYLFCSHWVSAKIILFYWLIYRIILIIHDLVSCFFAVMCLVRLVRFEVCLFFILNSSSLHYLFRSCVDSILTMLFVFVNLLYDWIYFCFITISDLSFEVILFILVCIVICIIWKFILFIGSFSMV